MQMSMRWYGPDDPVSLAYIRQVPGMAGIVSALHDVPVGQAWPLSAVQARARMIAEHNMAWLVVESINVHEDIKLGKPTRDAYIENYITSLRHVAEAGVRVVCYNLMPVFDWMRTNLAMPMPDGATALSYRHADMQAIDLTRGMMSLPAWANAYTPEGLQTVLGEYRDMAEDDLFDQVVYFLQAIVPAAAEAGVLLALHPDDPPWSIFGLPRIVRDHESIARLLAAVPHRHNGLTFCTGSLGAGQANDLPAMVEAFVDRIHFVHMRNVRNTGPYDFHESEHPSRFGDVDMAAVMRALIRGGFDGPIRPDHGRMIWGETGKPGYGLYDRALGAMYLQGLYEGIRRMMT